MTPLNQAMRAINQLPVPQRNEWRAQHGMSHYVFRPSFNRFAPKAAKRHIIILQYILFALLACTLGFFAQNATVGLMLVGVYGIIALILQLPSEHTFKAALANLLLLPIFIAFGHSHLLAIYAQYTFLLLGIGTASVLCEQWRNHILFEVGPHMRNRSVSPVDLRYKLTKKGTA
jgi:hypothetical protein